MKEYIKIETDKHFQLTVMQQSSILDPLVSCIENEVLWIYLQNTGANVVKLFLDIIYQFTL